MKTLLLLLASLAAASAQPGTVNFANLGATLDAPARRPTGELIAGPNWKAELLLISHVVGRVPTRGETSVVISGSPQVVATAHSLVLPGYFLVGLVEIAGAEPGQSATLRVRVSNPVTGEEGESANVTVTLGGGVLPPPNLEGLDPIVVQMLPRLEVSREQDRVVISWPDQGDYRLEQRDAVSAGDWLPAPEEVFLRDDRLWVTITPSAAARFYRLAERLN